MARKSGTSKLSAAINRHSRAENYVKKGLFKRKPSSKAAEKAAAGPVTKTIGGDKNGGKRTVAERAATRFYPAEETPRPKVSRKVARVAPLRASIVPGRVVILLAGRFRGSRVVVLKQLESGLLLVTGPFKVNGVPLKRVNQAYVIATSVKIDVSEVQVPEHVNDAYFKKASNEKKSAEEFFAEQSEKKLNETKVADQKSVDASIIKSVAKDKILVKYLKARFSLRKGQYPHAMKF